MADSEFIDALRDSAFKFLAAECPYGAVHRHIDDGAPFSRPLWNKVAALGWLATGAPERFGGIGDVEAIATLQEALGAHVSPVPFFGTILVTQAVSMWPGAPLADTHLPALISGAAIGATAILSVKSGLRLSGPDGRRKLNGAAHAVDAAAATLLLVRIECEGDLPGLAIIAADSDGLRMASTPVADRTRTVAALSLQDLPVPEGRLITGSAASSIIDAVSDTAMLLLAADALGGADAMLRDLVDYLNTRVQFGKPIGSFQALKHRTADLKASLELSRSLVREAAARLARGEADHWPAMAKASACETYVRVCSEAVQMHGGVGFTSEHHAHLFLKRALLDRFLFGTTADLQDRIASIIMRKGGDV